MPLPTYQVVYVEWSSSSEYMQEHKRTLIQNNKDQNNTSLRRKKFITTKNGNIH